MKLKLTQLRRLIREEVKSFRSTPNETNTATVYMSHDGAVLSFNGEEFLDSRNITYDINNDEEWDITRANQMIQDIKNLQKNGLFYVIDYENMGHENPVPVNQYIKLIQNFISDH